MQEQEEQAVRAYQDDTNTDFDFDFDFDFNAEDGTTVSSSAAGISSSSPYSGDNDNDDDDVECLKQVWINERGSPEIQDYEEELIVRVKARVSAQQQIVDEDAKDTRASLMRNILQMEIDRVQFLLTSYLRTRLRKIERHVIAILSSAEMTGKLSSAEEQFAAGFMDMMESHFNTCFLSHIPKKFASLIEVTKESSMIVQPDLDSHVVIKVNQDVGNFQISEDGAVAVDLTNGDILVTRYRPIRLLLQEGRVDLL